MKVKEEEKGKNRRKTGKKVKVQDEEERKNRRKTGGRKWRLRRKRRGRIG